MVKEGEGLMDGRKLAIYIMLISATAAVLSQTPMIQAIGRGQHTFVRYMNRFAKSILKFHK